MRKFKILLIVVYIILLVVSYFFVKNALKEEIIKVSEQGEEEKTVKVRYVNVTLFIEQPSIDLKFDIEMKNTNSVLEILEQLRLDEKITFEIDSYTFGDKLVHINGIYPDDSMEWRVFYDEKDITNEIGDVLLDDDAEYFVRLTSIK